MKRYILMFGAVLTTGASAQVVRMEASIPLPQIRFEVQPVLVEVSPGVQVVPDREEEIFFSDGFYWTRREGHWWRTRDWHGRDWREAGPRYVPAALVRIPEGRYRRWHAEEKAMRHEEKIERKIERQEEKHERHDEDHGHGHGHGHGR